MFCQTYSNINEYTKNIINFNIYNFGVKENLNKSSPNFNLIVEKLNTIFANARVMPAYCVSLHEETLQELKTDLWLEINFANEQVINDLNFNSLVFKLEDVYGINLIRLYNNKYEGRCIYVDFISKVDLKNILDLE